jgi:hypothetical protein
MNQTHYRAPTNEGWSVESNKTGHHADLAESRQASMSKPPTQDEWDQYPVPATPPKLRSGDISVNTEIGGLVFFDDSRRYEIEFPKDWKTSSPVQ